MSSRFYFKGTIPASKSLYNRALIVQSLRSNFVISGSAQSEDVSDLKNALDRLKAKNDRYKINSGGTSLRFLLARLSLEKGTFYVEASKRLLDRPHTELYLLLKQVRCEVSRTSANELSLVCNGWPNQNMNFEVDGSISSQFASAILLAATGHGFTTSLKIMRPSSADYFKMTVEFLRSIGFKINVQAHEGELIVDFIPTETPIKDLYTVEPDMSTAGTVAAFAASFGECELQSWPTSSLQPDSKFIDYLQRFGARVTSTGGTLKIQKSGFNSLELDLGETPDLAPILSVMLALASGESKILGLHSLKHKESDRLQKISELLGLMNVDHRVFESSVILNGPFNPELKRAVKDFDPDQDHRMAMAAQFARWAGCPIHILHPEVVEKSFADFWKVTKTP